MIVDGELLKLNRAVTDMFIFPYFISIWGYLLAVNAVTPDIESALSANTYTRPTKQIMEHFPKPNLGLWNHETVLKGGCTWFNMADSGIDVSGNCRFFVVAIHDFLCHHGKLWNIGIDKFYILTEFILVEWFPPFQ